MHNYHDTHKCLPPAALLVNGNVNYDCHSWYSFTLPFIEQQPLFDTITFNTIVGGGNNADLRGTLISAHVCPSDVPHIIQEDSNATWRVQRTNYVVNLGNTDYGHQDKGTVTGRAGPFRLNEKSMMASIHDGTSNTLMFSEVVVPKDTGWGGWYGVPMYGGGCGFTAYTSPNSLGPDEMARKCYSDLGAPDIAVCNTNAGSDHASVVNQVVTPRSFHPGGVNVSLCDGSVRFVTETIDLAVWRAASTASGKESETLP